MAEQHAGDEGTGQAGEPGREEGPDHVERAVGEVDHVHDAEHERQARGQQEQHQAELQSIERLLEKENTPS